MEYQLFIFITCLIIFDGIIASPKKQSYQVANDKVQTEKEYEINLSHLGNRIYGLPNEISGERVAKWNKNQGMNPEELGTYAEGDILFSHPTEKSAYAESFFRWPGAKIPYKITGYFSRTQRRMIMAAIDDFHKYTCLRFVPQTNENAYIRITSYRDGCYSSIGHTGYAYDVNFQTPGCTASKGTIIHELMHAAGFLHEQARSDRDDHISILWRNIDPENLYNFYTYKKEDLNDFGVPYDYNSVMHYSRYAFSVNGYPTLLAKPYSNYELGQRRGFSKLDVEKLNRMYQCKKEGSIDHKEKELIHPTKPEPEKKSSKNTISSKNTKSSKKRYLYYSKLLQATYFKNPSSTENENNDLMSFSEEETDKGQPIRLDYLGYKIYGLPTDETGYRVARWNPSTGVNPEELGTYVEGDILFSTPTTKSALKPEYYRWPGAKIPYYIMGGFSAADKQMIMAAINDFHKYTCLRFVPRTNEKAYIRITSHQAGCFSAIGHSGSSYDVNLQTPGCTSSKGTIIHELMHAAGFLHEQSRSDRDDHVSIYWNNIESDNAYNFYSYKKEDTNDFGVPYDYDSVMHYSRYAFSVNGYPTLLAKPYDRALGQRRGFSKLDIEKINRMYKCENRGSMATRGSFPSRQESVRKPVYVAPKPKPRTTSSGQPYLYCLSGRCWIVS
ncbi:hypothetical protein PV326_010378 [Microctonus aethiopoides]|nr:hypothetical protein PV326_010378 [Microctonus aethiopoides]